MKNAINYTSLATTSNGTLKAGIWLTALNEDIVNNDIVINSSTLPDTIEIKVNGVTHAPNVLPLLIAGFERCYGSKAQLTVSEHVKLAEAGFITPLQQNTTVTTTKEKGAFGNAKSVLTAIQYSNNCIKLGLQDKSFDSIAALVSEYYSLTDKATKADLHEMLKSFVDVFTNESQHATFVEMVRVEELAAKRFEALTTVGIINIKQVTEGHFNADIPMAYVSQAVPVITESGFDLIGTTMLPDMSGMRVSFKETV